MSAIRVKETADEERLRKVACYLSDIGWRGPPGLSRRAERRSGRLRLAVGRRSSRPGLSRRGAGRALHGPQAPQREPGADVLGGPCRDHEGAAAGGGVPGGLSDVRRHARRAAAHAFLAQRRHASAASAARSGVSCPASTSKAGWSSWRASPESRTAKSSTTNRKSGFQRRLCALLPGRSCHV